MIMKRNFGKKKTRKEKRKTKITLMIMKNNS